MSCLVIEELDERVIQRPFLIAVEVLEALLAVWQENLQ
jgi:hypothetical protein